MNSKTTFEGHFCKSKECWLSSSLESCPRCFDSEKQFFDLAVSTINAASALYILAGIAAVVIFFIGAC